MSPNQLVGSTDGDACGSVGDNDGSEVGNAKAKGSGAGASRGDHQRSHVECSSGDRAHQ